MMMLLVSMFFMVFMNVQFVGIFLYFVMFMYMLMNYGLFGADMIKGDLFGLLGLDYISFYMVMLLLWCISVVFILFYSWVLFFLVLILLFSLLVMFCSLDMLYLFIYFEFSMIPMFMIILFFGSYKERYYAGLYMFIYTMFSSLPTLLVLLILQSNMGVISVDYNLYNLFYIDSGLKIVVIFLFLVKVPMFLLHIWLPKAHVEAPVFGSMILASVMLKMGGYGVIRCLDFMGVENFISDFFFCFCLSGSVLISYFCLYQVDMKIMVAYSSVVHMGVMLMGFFSGSELGYLGGIIMMLSHGICSSGMFYLCNEIYKMTGSRLLFLNKGLMGGVPMLGGIWFFMLLNNLGVPPCFGILGEVFLMSGCLSYFFFIFFLFFIMVFFVSCFVINMFSLLVGGFFVFRFVNVNLFSYFGAALHLIPLNVFILFMGYCL